VVVAAEMDEAVVVGVVDEVDVEDMMIEAVIDLVTLAGVTEVERLQVA